MKNWETILREYEGRGSMTMKEFCAAKGISKTSIVRYQARAKKLAAKQSGSQPSGSNAASAASLKLSAGKRSMGVIAASKPKIAVELNKPSTQVVSTNPSQGAIDVSSEAKVRATFKSSLEAALVSAPADLSAAMGTLASVVEMVRRENVALHETVRKLEQEKAAIYSMLEKFAASLSAPKG